MYKFIKNMIEMFSSYFFYRYRREYNSKRLFTIGKWNRSTFDRTSLPLIRFQILSRLIFENDDQFGRKKEERTRNKICFPQILEAINSFDLPTKSKRCRFE